MLRHCLKVCLAVILGIALAIIVPEATWFSMRKVGPVATVLIAEMLSVNLWGALITPYILELIEGV